MLLRATRWAAAWRCGPPCATPTRYAGVVTVGATAGHRRAGRPQRARRGGRAAGGLDGDRPIDEVVGVWERQPLFADQSDALVEEQRAGRLSHDPRELALLLRTAGQGALEPVWDELLSLELPLLAVAGARDDGYARAAQRLADTAPRGRAAIVDDAGHAPQLQRPRRSRLVAASSTRSDGIANRRAGPLVGRCGTDPTGRYAVSAESSSWWPRSGASGARAGRSATGSIIVGAGPMDRRSSRSIRAPSPRSEPGRRPGVVEPASLNGRRTVPDQQLVPYRAAHRVIRHLGGISLTPAPPPSS